jgi:hypothetical protein
MTKEEVFELLNFIRNVYHNFTFDQEKLNTWAKLLKDQDKDKVFANAEQYAKDNRFAPTVADLRIASSEYRADTRNMDFLFQRWVSDGNDPELFDWSTGTRINH